MKREPLNGSFMTEGGALRASIEDATDRQERSIIQAIGEHADGLIDLFRPWALEIVAAQAYPGRSRVIYATLTNTRL